MPPLALFCLSTCIDTERFKSAKRNSHASRLKANCKHSYIPELMVLLWGSGLIVATSLRERKFPIQRPSEMSGGPIFHIVYSMNPHEKEFPRPRPYMIII